MNETHFLARRRKLLDLMDEGVAINASAPLQIRSNDTEYPYRQNSDFYYLTGFEESNAAIVLIKSAGVTKTIFYIEPYNAEYALWNGAKLGIEKAKSQFSVDEVVDINDFDISIKEHLREHVPLYIALFDESP